MTKKNILLLFLFLACALQRTAAQSADRLDTQTREVRGFSMLPLAKPGERVTVQFGYYGHREIERGDLVAYRYSGDPVPLLKRVRAVPGDNWDLVSAADGTFGIDVNGKELTNSGGQPYAVSAHRAKLLGLYVHDYPKLPPDTYLILGELPTGTVDSTEFGLVDKSDILGKVSLPGAAEFKTAVLSASPELRYIDATPTMWTCTLRSNTQTNLTTATISCTGTEKVVEGGCDPTAGGGTVLASVPLGQGWGCTSSVANLTAYANCCQ